MHLSARASRIAVSPTMKVAADAMKLKAQGVDIVDFGAGEPDFPTPPASAEKCFTGRTTSE
jgi:aspartate aminotransferase